MKTIKQLLLITVIFALAACDQATIVAPINNFVSDAKPVSFEIAFSSGIPADLEIQLNASIVTDAFTVTEFGASGNNTALADHIVSGKNYFLVTGYNKTSQAIFYYDTDGPSIHILDADQNAMTVSGYVSDPAGIQSFDLNGVAITLDGSNAFTAPYSNTNIHTFTATDMYGHQSTTQYAHRDNEFDGITARLNQGGLDFLISALITELRELDFQDIVDTIGKLELIDAGLFEINLTVTTFDFDDINIDLTINDDETIDSYIWTKNFEIGMDLDGRILFLPWSSGAVMHLDELEVSTDFLMDIVNSDLDIALSNTSISHTTPEINFNKRPTLIDSIISSMVGTMAPLFEKVFIDILEKLIIPIISDFIKDIPITLQLVTLDDGETVTIKALPSFLDSKENGISVDLRTHIIAPEPVAGIPGALGSLYHEGETPSLGATTPEGEAFDFGASISSNVINQALLAAHESGVTTMDISPGFYDHATPAGITVYSAGMSIEETDQIGMRIEPASPPFVTFASAEDGVAGTFGWRDVKLTFDLYKTAWGEYRTLFGVTFNLEVPYEVNATEDGFLSIGIEKLPTIYISKTDDTGMLVLPASFINSTLDYFMPAVMPRLAETLKVVPLPRIYEHTLFMEDFWAAGSGANSLSIAGSLIPISVTEAAAAPTTTIENVQADTITTNRDSVDAVGVVSSEAIEIKGGYVTIDIDGLNPNADLGLLEHRYRVDGGGWSVWKPRDDIHLQRLLAGTHQVEVCSRTVLMKLEVSCPVVEFETEVTYSH